MTEDASNAFRLVGKTILVTGASSGIGRACAVEVARLGAQVIVSGRNEERLAETLRNLAGDRHISIAADLSSEDGRARLSAGLPVLDGVVHSAGVNKVLPAAFTGAADFEKINSVNAEAPIVLTTRLLKEKKIAGNASIVFIASVSSVAGWTGLMSYAASKAALVGAARVLAVELGRRGVRVNCVSPGMVMTPMNEAVEAQRSEEARKEDLKRYPLGYGRPEDVAYSVAFLLSPASRWITGTNLVVDGGYTAI
jgi:NAD(P)-dependent dehydrogenase (short-subunit alcohol dehydrogenase family)